MSQKLLVEPILSNSRLKTAIGKVYHDISVKGWMDLLIFHAKTAVRILMKSRVIYKRF